MELLKAKDFLEVRFNELIADYDKEILANLYQPIIGFTAFALYLTLVAEANNEKIASMIDHKTIFNRMKITESQFIEARQYLEGVGLLKTFKSKTGESNVYHYELHSPDTPKKFFDNVLLHGMLIQAIGKQAASRLKSLYTTGFSSECGDDISVSFDKAFKPDFNDPSFSSALNGSNIIIGREGAKIRNDFSFDTFFTELSKISQIKPEAFSKKDVKEIERLSSLYGADEKSAASYVAQIFNPLGEKNNHIDFYDLAKLFREDIKFAYVNKNRQHQNGLIVSSDSDLGSKINLMEQKSPKQFLMYLQNMTEPAESDMKIIEGISRRFGLSNGVINALIDYTLIKKDNILVKNYMEAVAGSLAREGVQNALDAMNYLNRVSNNARKRIESKAENISEESAIQEEQINDENEYDNLDWNSLIDIIDGGDDDGKA